MKPDFSKINFKDMHPSCSSKEWEAKSQVTADWMTTEQIAVKPVYGVHDLEKIKHLSYAAGLPPFLRGPYSTMYVMKP